MKYLTLISLLVLSLACGKLPEIPDAGGQTNRIPEAVPVVTTPELTLCEAFEDALYCADGGVPASVGPGVPNGASIGLFARFEPSPSLVFLDHRLVELGGHMGPGGGAALTLSGVAGINLVVGCAWWNMFGGAWTVVASLNGSEQTAYCEVDSHGARLYVDGVLAASETAMPYYSTTGVIGVGRAANLSSYWFEGELIEVGIFSSLTDDEIALISQ